MSSPLWSILLKPLSLKDPFHLIVKVCLIEVGFWVYSILRHCCFNIFNPLLLPCQASYKEAMVWRCSNSTNSPENICAGVSLRSIITAKDSSAGFFLRVLWNFWKHLLCKPSANSYFWILACRDCWNLTHFQVTLKYCVPFFLTTNYLKCVWPFLAGLEGLSLIILSFTYFSETFFNFFH